MHRNVIYDVPDIRQLCNVVKRPPIDDNLSVAGSLGVGLGEPDVGARDGFSREGLRIFGPLGETEAEAERAAVGGEGDVGAGRVGSRPAVDGGGGGDEGGKGDENRCKDSYCGHCALMCWEPAGGEVTRSRPRISKSTLEKDGGKGIEDPFHAGVRAVASIKSVACNVGMSAMRHRA